MSGLYVRIYIGIVILNFRFVRLTLSGNYLIKLSSDKLKQTTRPPPTEWQTD